MDRFVEFRMWETASTTILLPHNNSDNDHDKHNDQDHDQQPKRISMPPKRPAPRTEEEKVAKRLQNKLDHLKRKAKFQKADASSFGATVSPLKNMDAPKIFRSKRREDREKKKAAATLATPAFQDFLLLAPASVAPSVGFTRKRKGNSNNDGQDSQPLKRIRLIWPLC